VFKPEPFGNYLLIEKVSVGGMAEVYKALMFGLEGFQKLVAMKRLLQSVAEDEEFARMFVDEANIAGQLHHANIAQIYDLGRIGPTGYFIAMEYVQGRDLRAVFDRLKKIKRGVPLNMAVHSVAKICEGLDYAHRKADGQGKPLNIVHRDISPPNIILSYEGDVKLIDFGIAKAAKKFTQTQAGILKGKFGYMSPEQVRGMPLDRRSDIFSIGIVLYEMITGRRLFVGSSDFNTLEKVRSAEIKPPSEFNPHIPKQLEDAVMKSLARDINERYQWPSEFQEDLQRYLYSQEHVYSRQDLAEFMATIFAEDLQAERHRMEELDSMDFESIMKEHRLENFQSMKSDKIEALPQQQREGFVGPKGEYLPPDKAFVMDVDEQNEPIRLVTDDDSPAVQEGTDHGRDRRPTPMPTSPTPTNIPPASQQTPTGRHRVNSASSQAPYRIKPKVARRADADEMAAALKPRWFAVAPQKKNAWLTVMALLVVAFGIAALTIALKSPFPEVTMNVPVGVKTAKVTFYSDAEDVNVQLIPVRDGIEMPGQTKPACPKAPCVVPNVPVGVYRVEFRNAQSLYTVARFMFEDGGEYVIPARFGPPGQPNSSLILSTDPPGATFQLKDGSTLVEEGRTPKQIMEVPSGHKLSLAISKEGYRYEVLDVMVDPYSVKKLTVPLKAAQARVKVSVKPKGAAIYINGKNTGKTTPAEFTDLKVGKSYTFTFKKKKYKDLTRDVTPTGGDDPVPGEMTPVAEAQKTGTSGSKTRSRSRSGTGVLKVSSTPRKVEFKVRGKRAKAPTRLNLSPGSFKLNVIINAKLGLDITCASGKIRSGKTTSCKIVNRGGSMWKCDCKEPE